MIIKELNNDLNLKNDGNLEIVFIGTGSAFSQLLGNNNIIIIKGDTHVVIDFGLTAPFRFKSVTGLDLTEIENILITHSHSDHIGGVEYLTLQNKYIGQSQGKPKLKLLTTKEYKNILWKKSLSGGLQFNEVSGEEKRKLKLSDYFDFVFAKKIGGSTRKKYAINFNGIKLELFHTNHIPDSAINAEEAFITYGLYIDDKVLFSGDTKFDLDLINDYKDRSEYIFHDCSFFPNPVHADFDSLSSLPADVKKKMFLMHYSDNDINKDVPAFAGLAKYGQRYIFD